MSRAPEGIPRFHLYGETGGEDDELDFLHHETILARARLHDWVIKPHRHDRLYQVLFVAGGGGVLTIDTETVEFRAPALMVFPPAIVHGLRFVPDTRGHVVTISDAFLYRSCGAEEKEAAAGGLAAALDEWLALALREEEAREAGIEALCVRLADELRWPRRRRTEAIAACVKLLAVAVDRLREASAAAHGRAGALPAGDVGYARFRHLVELRYRERRDLAAYAAELGTTPARLNAACKRAVGATAGRVIRRRLLLEAKRSLIYTSMTATEIAYDLGFADPAYFSRFFRQHTGRTPSAFRAAGRRAATGGDGTARGVAQAGWAPSGAVISARKPSGRKSRSREPSSS